MWKIMREHAVHERFPKLVERNLGDAAKSRHRLKSLQTFKTSLERRWFDVYADPQVALYGLFQYNMAFEDICTGNYS